MNKTLLVTSLLPLIFGTLIAFGAVNVQANIVNYENERTFTVGDDFLAVKETKSVSLNDPDFLIKAGANEVFTIFNPVEGDPLGEEKKKETLDSIKVSTASGEPLEYILEELENGSVILKVPHTEALYFGETKSINLEYTSYGLLIRSGAIKDIYVPGFPEDYEFNTDTYNETVSTSLIIPESEKEVNFIFPEHQVDSIDSVRVIDIPQESLLLGSTWLQLGKEQYYGFSIEQEIPASTSLPFMTNTFTLPIPADASRGSVNQEVFFTQFSPEPFQIVTDKDGNLLAEYRLPAHKSHQIKINGYSVLKQNEILNEDDSGSISDIPTYLLDDYTSSANFWEVDSIDIQEVAKNISDSENINQITKDTFQFVTDRIDYSFVKKYGINERQGALQTLNGSAAVCMEYSDLFITLMRAQGIPARAAYGYGYGALDYEAREEGYINHQWAEVYYPGLDRWIPVDTTWGDFGSLLFGGDLNHFYSHVSSIDPETPSSSAISYFGSIGKIPERNMSISILDTDPTIRDGDSAPEITAQFSEKTTLEITIFVITSGIIETGMFLSELPNLIKIPLGIFLFLIFLGIVIQKKQKTL